MVLKLVLTVVAIFSLINMIQCNTQDMIQSKLQNVMGIIEELANGLDCGPGILHTVYTSTLSLG